MPWYKQGSVTTITGETSITGTDTKFATNARVGDSFRGPDGLWYEITNIASETVLGIYPAYQGASVSTSTNYTIVPIQGYNKETADRLRAITDGFTVVTSVQGKTGDVIVTKADVGLPNVDNTADLSKPLSTIAETRFNQVEQNQAATDSTVATIQTNVNTNTTNIATKASKGVNNDITELNALTKQITVNQGGVNIGYIEGLIPSFVTNGLTIGTGAAYIPGTSKTLAVTSPITLTGISGLSTDVFYYAYLYDNAGTVAVEFSTVAPSAPYSGSARTKTGNTSRRFIFALRTGAGGTLYRFQWGNDGYIRYLTTTGSAPFRVLNLSAATAKTNVDCSSVVPATTQIALTNLINAGSTQSMQLSHPDTAGNDILLTVPSGSRIVVPVALDSSRRFAFFNSATGGQSVADILGYGTDR